MQRISASVRLEEKDFLKFKLMDFIGSVTKVLMAVLVFAIFIYLLINFLKTGKNFLLTFFTTLASASYFVSLFYLIPKSAKTEYEASSYKDSEMGFEADEEGVKLIRGKDNVSSIPWNSFHAVWHKWQYYFFYISKNNIVQVPERCLDESSNARLKELIKAHVKPSKRKNPNRMEPVKLAFNIILALLAVSVIVYSFLSLLGIAK